MTDVAPRQSDSTPPGPPQDVNAGRPVDRTVFGVAAATVAAFVLWGALDPTAMGETTTSTLTWLEKSFGWLFVLTTAMFVLFSAYLALSRYGNIRLGPDDSTPEFSTFSWVSMMFATGMGIGLIFWGVAEPLTHLNTPPLGIGEPGTPETARVAMEYTFFHWGLHPWSIYAVIGLAIAYFAYRKKSGNLISGTFRPLIGDAAGPRARQGDRLASRSSPPSSAPPPRSGSAPCRSPAASTTSSTARARASCWPWPSSGCSPAASCCPR